MIIGQSYRIDDPDRDDAPIVTEPAIAVIMIDRNSVTVCSLHSSVDEAQREASESTAQFYRANGRDSYGYSWRVAKMLPGMSAYDLTQAY